ncbi:hypothetical protein GCM10022255_059820 [Dactylosporangium darangshiense]|uniref:Integral membrane protein n=2 Tax=Dactylosporangium darangshiense TaxID=579108 RepID=A0ABP8DF95_9ACTN
MVGVVAPMLRRSPEEAHNFMFGYLAGYLAGGSLLVMIAYGVGRLLEATVPHLARIIAWAAVLVVLGVLDIVNRTPHAMRQVPQRHARNVSPGWRGVVWSFDLALLFTTRKTTSLVWAALATLVLLDPGGALWFLAVMVIVSVGQLVIGTYLDHLMTVHNIGGELLFIRLSRVVSGGVMVCLAVALTLW